MYLLYLLLIVTSFAVCSDLPISSRPSQDKGRHCRKMSVIFSQVPTSSIQNPSNVSSAQKISCVQELIKDTPLKASQDDNDDLVVEALVEEIVAQNGSDTEEEPIFPMDL